VTRAEAAAIYAQGRAATVRTLLAQARQITALEARLAQTSQTSSRPPSSDPPGTPRPHRPPSGRRPGGQPGHPGHHRPLVPVAQVQAVVPCVPTHCHRCGRRLRGTDPTPRRHQVTEVPPVRPVVTEYQRHTLGCRCGAQTTGALPPGVPAGAFGPRLVALAALCTGVYHLSRRTTVGLLHDLCGVELALGSVTACEQATSQALAGPVAAAQAYVQQQPVAHVDETGWREARGRAWLWVATTVTVSVFLIHARRGVAAAQALLGAFAGLLISDRWSAYAHWPLRGRQLCWAHLRRHFAAFAELAGAPGPVGQALLAETDQLFTWWHRVRDGTLSRATFQRYVRPLRRRVEALLLVGSRGAHGPTAATCRELLILAPALWTFVRVPGVEPTNNAAERALRGAVLWRKGCFGTHSAAGSRFAERMLTVAATLRQQDRNLVTYVTQACTASLCGEPAPSLLPAAVPCRKAKHLQAA
jgi:transposase